MLSTVNFSTCIDAAPPKLKIFCLRGQKIYLEPRTALRVSRRGACAFSSSLLLLNGAWRGRSDTKALADLAERLCGCDHLVPSRRERHMKTRWKTRRYSTSSVSTRFFDTAEISLCSFSYFLSAYPIKLIEVKQCYGAVASSYVTGPSCPTITCRLQSAWINIFQSPWDIPGDSRTGEKQHQPVLSRSALLHAGPRALRDRHSIQSRDLRQQHGCSD